MGVRIDKVEADVQNNTLNIEDARAEMRTIRSAWNAVTIATFLGAITVFAWLDSKIENRFAHADSQQTEKFNGVLAEIAKGNEQVSDQFRQVNTEMKLLSEEIVRINQSVTQISKEHDERGKR